MATEGSTIDQATQKKVEEMKMDDDIKQVNEESVSQQPILEGTYDEEKLKVEGATSVQAPADESNALIEDVKKEESKEDSAGEATEKELESEAAEISEDNSEVLLLQISKDEAEIDPAVDEAVTEETKDKDDLPSASESTGEATRNELESDAVEKSEDNLEAPLMQESEVEAKEPAVDEEVTEEMRDTNDLPSASELTGEITEKEPESQIAEKSKVDLEAPLMQEAEVEAAKGPPVAQEVREELKDNDNLPSSSESTGEATEKEPESEAAENMEAPVMQESEVEAEKEPPVAEAVTEEMKDKYGPPSASETEDKEAQSAAVTNVKKFESDISATPDASRSAEVIVNGFSLAEVEDNFVPSKEEPSSDDIPVVSAATNEDKDAGASLPEVPGTPEKTDYNPNANDGIEEPVKEESVTGEIEVLKKSKEVAENEGKATEGEDPPSSEVFKGETVIEVAEVLSQGGDVENTENSEVDSLGGDKATWVETSKYLDAPVSVTSSEGVKAAGVSDFVEGGKSLEGDKTTLAETSRDLNVDSTVNDDSKVADSETKVAEATEAIIDKSVNEELEDTKDENEKVAEAKDDGHTTMEGEAPKQEVPIRSSQRQSNNILSKVKQSIVKVKKAIIGKSPSSKTMSSEGKGDIKVQ